MSDESVRTVAEALQWLRGRLEGSSAVWQEPTPRLAAEQLLGMVCGLDRVELPLHYDRQLSQAEKVRLRNYAERRLAAEPLQYIRGSAPFRYLDMKVCPGVLIPRPETEGLVELALEWIRALATAAPAAVVPGAAVPATAAAPGAAAALLPPERGGERLPDTVIAGAGVASAEAVCITTAAACPVLQVLDIGCGSGAIALSLLQEAQGVADLQVLATDIDPQALALTEENARVLSVGIEQCRPAQKTRHCGPETQSFAPPSKGKVAGQSRNNRVLALNGASLELRLDDLASSLLAEPGRQASFDLVISNPPYVPSSELAALPHEVAAFEPQLALDGGNDGLAVFRRLLDQAACLLRSGGMLAVELHESTLASACRLAEAAGFDLVQPHVDLNNRPRYLTAQR